MTALTERRLRLALRLLVTVAALRFGFEVLAYARPGFGEDVAQHWVASRVLAAGNDPYVPGVTARAGAASGLVTPGHGSYHFLERHHYPPLGLLVWAPLSRLPFRTAVLVWLLASALVWLACLPLLEKVLGMTGGSSDALLLRGALLTFAPALGVLSLGQLEIFVFALLLAGLTLEGRGRPWLAGAPIALAILLKLIPGAWLIYYLVLRRWRMVGSIVAWAVGLTAASLPFVGTATYRSFVASSWAFASAREGWQRYVPSNLSLQSFAFKGFAFLSGGHAYEHVALWVGRTAGLAVFLATLVVLLRARRRGDRADLAGLGLLCAATSLASALTWQHHLVWLALPLGVALRWSWETADLRRFTWGFLLPYVLIGQLDPWLQPLRDLTVGLGKDWRDVLWTITPAAIAVGVALCWVFTARLAWERHPPEPGPRS